MYQYKAPLQDMQFLLHNATKDNSDLSFILDEAAKFVEHEIAPVNANGDQEGCIFADSKVTLPNTTKTAFKRYVESGWMGLTMPEEFGGQQLPETIGGKVGEMLSSANNAISMIAGLTMSACNALIEFASPAIKQDYLANMIAGHWTGTMCLTEPHCGSDLGLIKTSATAINETDFEISGTKIFISAGEHDASDNIIHLVLARIKGSSAGVKGLSLFLVPKYLADTPQNPNSLTCIGIEEKMGIHANPTCTMAFEQAKGFLVGKPNQGIQAMFKMMNEMRLGAAVQGVGLSECAFQASYDYATERKQGKTLNNKTRSQNTADKLIVHADIKRMLLSQKAFAEGGRALCHYCAQLLDTNPLATEEITKADKLLGLLTPIAKAFLTETGLESASNAIQTYGGHGYIRENGVEQIYRDGRISTIYEGTTGIQALDLLGRKVLADQAQTLLVFTDQINTLCETVIDDQASPISLIAMAKQLTLYTREWLELTEEIANKALHNPNEIGAASYDFLMYSGYVSLAYFWLDMANTARVPNEHFTQAFLQSKIKTARFYFDKLLPKAKSHRLTLQSGADSLLDINEDEWCFV